MAATQPARGTRDFLPDDIRRREHVVAIVREVYQRYGFEPLETPAFENIETLLGKYGEEGNQLIFKILKRGEHAKSGEADLALRYDLTVPLARVIAEYQGKIPTIFKRYQIQPVWRADRPARGRFREFHQCDIDVIGSTSVVVEVEILSAVSEILKALGFDDFSVRLNHRRILAAVLNEVDVAPERHSEVLVELDKLDKVGKEGVAAGLAARGIPASTHSRLLDWIGGPQHPPDWLDQLESRMTRLDDWGRAGFQNVREILGLVDQTPAAGKTRFEPSLARGLSYYTGAIMEIAVEGIGSLGGGGRYDNLVGMFLGRDVPACGFSLGLERIIVVMTERHMFPASVAHGAVDVVVTFMDDDSRGEALRLAAELRSRTLGVDIFPEASRKFEKPLKYATARRAKLMAIFGENERVRGEVSVRNLETREQQTVARDAAASLIAKLLDVEL